MPYPELSIALPATATFFSVRAPVRVRVAHSRDGLRELPGVERELEHRVAAVRAGVDVRAAGEGREPGVRGETPGERGVTPAMVHDDVPGRRRGRRVGGGDGGGGDGRGGGGRRGTARRVALASAGHAREANIGPIVVDEKRPAPGVTACERLRLRESCAFLRAVGERGVAVDCARGRNSDSRSCGAVGAARSGE